MRHVTYATVRQKAQTRISELTKAKEGGKRVPEGEVESAQEVLRIAKEAVAKDEGESPCLAYITGRDAE